MNKRFEFRLAESQLCDVVEQFRLRFADGLQKDSQEFKCLPAFIPVDHGPLTGEAYVVDLGGSNLRASYIKLDGPDVYPPLSTTMPWQRGVAFDRLDYLDEQASLLVSLPQVHTASLGYCFSYPTDCQVNGDGRLIRWTKGVQVPGTEGELVGANLLAYLRDKYQRTFSCVAVANDTVTSLLAGLTLGPVDVYAGLIAGTGMNLAALVQREQIEKLAPSIPVEGRLPINIESGNFSPPHLSEWDQLVDAESENPGEQRFEKAVSGMYLGRLFALANPDVGFEPESGARGLVDLIQTHPDDAVRDAALSLYQRSAQLVAAQLAGLACFYREYYQARTMRVVAEGGLAWSKVSDSMTYHQLLDSSLQQLLRAFGIDDLQVDIVRVHHANLIGAAVAAVQLEKRCHNSTDRVPHLAS